MKKYYGVIVEYYDYGTVKAAIIERKAKKKPNVQRKILFGVMCFTDWFENQKEAQEFLLEVKAAWVIISRYTVMNAVSQ